MSARHTPITDAVLDKWEHLPNSRSVAVLNQCRRFEIQRTALLAWKESALLVESEWDVQAVGKLLGVPLGESIRANIQPRITALLAALEAQVEADRLSGIYQTYADAPAHASDPDYDSRCDEMHAAWMQAQDLAEKLRDAALSAARGDGKGEG